MKKIILVVAMSFILASCGFLTSDEDKLKEAKAFLNAQQYNSSIVLLKGLLQDNASNAEARLLLGKLYHEIGEYEGASKELSRAFNGGVKNSEVANLWLSSLLNLRSYKKITQLLEDAELANLLPAEDKIALKGWVLLSRNQLTDAKAVFEQSLETLSSNYYANLGMVHYYLAKKNIPQALMQIDTALGYMPNDTELMLLKAKIEMSKKQYQTAQLLLEKVLKNEPSVVVTSRAVEARVTLIRILLVQEKTDEASKLINTAYRLSPQHPIIAYFEGYELFRKKEFDKAREILLTVINSVPGHKPSLLLLGTISYQDKNYEQATLYLTNFLRNNEKHTSAIKMLGVSQLYLDQSKEALATLKPVLEGGDFDVLKIAGAAALASGDTSKGAKFLESAIANNPDDLNIRIELARAYLSMGDKAAAKKELKNAMSSKGGDSESRAFSLLINLHLQEKNYDLALALAKEEAKQNATAPVYPNVIGQIYARQKNFSKAQKFFQQAIKLDAEYWPAGLNLAKVYLLQKDFENADAVYDQLLKADAKNEKILWDHARYLIAVKRSNAAVKDLEKLLTLNSQNIQAARLLIQLFNDMGEKDKSDVVLANLAKTKQGKVFVQHMKGNTALQQGDAKLAIQTYEEIVAENPRSYVGYYDLAKAHLKNNNQSAARIALEKSLKIKPDFLPAVSLSIKIEIVSKNFKKADKAIRALIKKSPTVALGYELKGDLFSAQNKQSEAASSYKKAAKLSDNIGIFVKYTRSLYRAGSSTKAQKALLAKIKTSGKKDRTSLQMELIRIYKKDGKKAKRVALLKTMASENIGKFGELNDIAWLLHYDDVKAAEKYAKMAYKLKPDLGPINDTYGWILLQNGKKQKALKLLTEANRLSPNSLEIQYHLAVALFESKQYDESKRMFKKLSRQKKDFEGKGDVANYLKKMG